jgi:WD40 repeat protein
MALRPLNADDIFISYTRRDASTYAAGLANELSKKGFSCFIDKLGTDPDKDLPDSLKRKIRNSAMLVVVGTQWAGTRQTIEDEIGEFVGTGRTSIVPVDFDGAVYKARWYRLIEGIAPEAELNPNALDDGDPSPSVISRIEKQFNYRRRDERLRRITRRAVAVLVGLVIAIAAAAGIAWYQLKRAADATANAREATAKAEQAGRDAEKALAQAFGAQAEALMAKTVAEVANADATEQKRLAGLASDEAAEKARLADEAARRAQEAEASRVVAQASADRQQAIAEARSLANRSQTLLRQQPEALTRSISLAIDSVKRASAIGVQTVEADTALRESLSLLPHPLGNSRYSGDIIAATFSPDARHFAALFADATLRVYRRGEATPFKEIRCEGAEVNGVSTTALSNDATFAAVSSEKSVTIYDLKSGGSHRIEIKEESITIGKVALSPGGKYVALILEDGELEDGVNRASVRNAASGVEIKSIFENLRYNDVSFSANGNLAFGARAFPNGPLSNFTGQAVIWQLSAKLQGDESASKLTAEDFAAPETHDQDDEIFAITPGPDDASYATDRAIWRRVSLGGFKAFARFPVNEDEDFNVSHPVQSMAFTADGKGLAVLRGMPLPDGSPAERVGTDRAVEFWDATQHLDVMHVYQTAAIQSVGFLPGDRLVAAAPLLDNDEHLRVFNVADGAEPNPEAGRPTEGEKKFISADARFVVTVSDTNAYVRDVWRSSVARVDFGRDLQSFGALALTKGGEFLALAGDATGGEGTTALVYTRDGDSYRRVRALNLGREHVLSTSNSDDATKSPMAVTPDGNRLVTLSEGTARVWDVAAAGESTPAALRNLTDVSSIKLSDAGHYLAAIYKDTRDKDSESVFVLRLADGGAAGRTTHRKRVNVVVFSPSERYLLTSGEDRMTRLLELNRGPAGNLHDDSPVLAAAFSADERYFATGSSNGALLIFATGEPQTEITRLQDAGAITTIAFSSDARLLATASRRHNPYDIDYEDNFPLRIWRLRPGDLLAEAEGRLAALPSYLR